MRKRKRMAVHGVVQGVGFRPFVYGLADRLGLGGAVWNSSTGVVIDVEGSPSAIDRFAHALTTRLPGSPSSTGSTTKYSRPKGIPDSASVQARIQTRHTSAFPPMSRPVTSVYVSCTMAAITGIAIRF